MLKIGIAKVGRNAEGSRRVLIRLRLINWPALRIVVECMSEVFRCVIEFVFTSLLAVLREVEFAQPIRRKLRLQVAQELHERLPTR